MRKEKQQYYSELPALLGPYHVSLVQITHNTTNPLRMGHTGRNSAHLSISYSKSTRG
jgi:hypothetical protein